VENNIDTIIGVNVTLKGNLKNKGSIQLNGSIEGELRSDEHINVGETAHVKGPIIAKTVEVSGEVNGLIEASERLEIHPTGKVIGDINAKSLIIQQGANLSQQFLQQRVRSDDAHIWQSSLQIGD
jgi:cytoskeletal protein CcmA (bactofilin family)